MQIESYKSLISTENKARLHLVRNCWVNRSRFCIKCGSKKVYRLAGKRYRCPACKYTFGDFTGRWVGQLNISAQQWLWLVKLFELDVSSHRIASELELSYPTALKATHLIRLAIVSHLPDFEEFAGEVSWTRATLVAGAKASEDVAPPEKCRCLAFWSVPDG